MRHCMVVYDIPSVKKVAERIANPSGMFRRFGFRANYSCWIVPEHNLPLMPLDELKEKGAKVEVVRFDESEYDKIMGMARSALREEAAGIRGTLQTTVHGIKTRYREALETRQPSDLDKAALYHYLNLRRIKQLMVSIQECCMAFDLTGDFADLFDALRKSISVADREAFDLHQNAEKRLKP